MNNALRIAHLSDPHFQQISYHPGQFFSKRFIGNFNLIFSRRRAYQTEHLWHLPELIDSLDVQAVFITGDFSSTSLDKEFAEASKFAAAFKKKGLETFVVPGNHDCYTKKVQKNRRFYSFFPSENMKSKKIEAVFLGQNWWYIGLDCAVASPPFFSYGVFEETTEQHLHEALLNVPQSDQVVIANHFPLFSTGHPRHDLKRMEALQNLLKSFPQVKIYLHGHDHLPYIIDKQNEGFPLAVNSGSCAHKPNGMFYVIDLFKNECLIQHLLFRKDTAFSWVIDWQKNYSFSRYSKLT